ncbi:MAG: endopeptidase La, partial [Acidimicrobiia bacterium]|nr:endopeptidase La [Acidimicrobiia bacterium]
RIGTGSTDDNGALWVEAEIVTETDVINDPALEELVTEYRAVVSEVLNLRGVGRMADQVLSVDNPSHLADLAVYSPDLSMEQKVEVLETLDLRSRLGRLLGWMREVLADLNLRKKVREEAADKIDKGQRDYILRQQMEAIRRELGDEDDIAGEYRAKLEEADMPEEVAKNVTREIDRLDRMSEQSPEHSWIRTWLDTMFEIPWSKKTEDRLDLDEAWTVLDADHTGLHDVKERIIEHLAVRKLRHARGLEGEEDRRAGAILLLVGPPGVGKTSLGESVARALGREFVRVALGGVRDEAEIRGHRRTYVGARPGRIVRALVEAGTMNPVFLLDEMDKVGNDWRGDPSSALLEVLDPAQNHTFRDNYLESDLDLSSVLFIATANIIESIPAPLLDRTEVINIDGYTDAEKVEIARDHLLPRQLRGAGLEPEELEVSDDALTSVVDRYTREAGVRNLERQLGKLSRKVATEIARGSDGIKVIVTDDNLVEYLGKPKVWKDEAKDRTDVPGVATGLAVTGSGGDVLFIEATAMEGKRDLVLTGQLGDVMKESARIALSYLESHADLMKIDPKSLDRSFHIHVPAGAIPKDGPSAGITMTTAIASLLTGRKVRPEVGMTGEVTLQGKVLPIGGLKQKVLAAHRAGLIEVIIPRRNEIDIDDIPEAVRDQMIFHIADDIGQVLDWALA